MSTFKPLKNTHFAPPGAESRFGCPDVVRNVASHRQRRTFKNQQRTQQAESQKIWRQTCRCSRSRATAGLIPERSGATVRKKNMWCWRLLKTSVPFLRNHGIDARLTRSGDTFIPLYDRVEIAHKHGADLFMSIHADGFTNPKAAGASVFALSNRGGK